MTQLITANSALNLYWLGRYLERIEASLIDINRAYDNIIDVDKNEGVALFLKLGIEIEYVNSSEFLNIAIFGEHSANLFDLLSCARENAIISRSYIEAEAFGSIIELHKHFELAQKNNFYVDFRFIDTAMSLISEIWGELTRKQTRKLHDYFIAMGKNVEKVDMSLRIGRDKEFALVVMKEIDTIVSILAPNASFKPHDTNDSDEVILASINNKINKITNIITE
ncbi:MAG: alpha-E domain-containing protein [Arcobacter sp.]|nr:alpha-E domain-containing protein [Arcobacter sp.]